MPMLYFFTLEMQCTRVLSWVEIELPFFIPPHDPPLFFLLFFFPSGMRKPQFPFFLLRKKKENLKIKNISVQRGGERTFTCNVQTFFFSFFFFPLPNKQPSSN
eukprot:TRINITY_DN5953_c3_g1_i1.p2 TRINITY_DN5953_c3_g1~~TRINITY_DN5953_c3_g1_i1.p2  ORF type:complete len:112 (-),score=12.44 TRINITY_DN5953_c3_g1_i1:893-1201(-)